jgi:hypothetical protein
MAALSAPIRCTDLALAEWAFNAVGFWVRGAWLCCRQGPSWKEISMPPDEGGSFSRELLFFSGGTEGQMTT